MHRKYKIGIGKDIDQSTHNWSTAEYVSMLSTEQTAYFIAVLAVTPLLRSPIREMPLLTAPNP